MHIRVLKRDVNIYVCSAGCEYICILMRKCIYAHTQAGCPPAQEKRCQRLCRLFFLL